jgi:hypothetical protein
MIRRADLIDLKREIALHNARRRAREGGFGFHFGVGSRAGSKKWEPTALSLTGYWRADYSGAPWVGTSSAGSSGSHNLTAGSAPSTGTAVNGYTPASCSFQYLTAGSSTNYFGSASLSGFVLAKVSSNGFFMGGSPHPILLNIGTTTISVQLNNGATVVTRSGSIGSTWALVTFRYDGSTFDCGINEAPGASGGGSTTSFSSTLSTTTDLRVCGGVGTYYGGDVLEIALASTALTNQNFADIKTYCNQRYALAL